MVVSRPIVATPQLKGTGRMQTTSVSTETEPSSPGTDWRQMALRWGAVLITGIAIILLPHPSDITPASWRLLAIFAATVVGLIAQPLPGGAMVLLGVTAV